MTLRARLRQRWDIDPARDMSFPREVEYVNVGRVELVCLIGLVNNLIEIVSGFDVLPIQLEVALAIGWIVAVHFLRGASPTAQRVCVVLFIVSAMLGSHVAVYDLAIAKGAMFSGYLLRLLILSTFFVLSPRLLGILILFGLMTHAAMLAMLPATLPRLRALSNATIVSGIGYVAGWLIYSARRLDYERRTLIAAQNERLTAQNVELDQLMAITAHDLRSPLYGLRHLLDLADRRADTDPTLPRRVLREAVEGLDAMQALVTRLLDAHAAEHAPLGVATIHDIRACADAAVRRAGPQAAAGGVTVRVDLPEQPVLTRIDDAALARILDNLVCNAVRYSPAGAVVVVALVRQGADAVVSITDTGPGIAPAHQPQLFRKFDRAGADAGLKSGTGMGLFIAATFAARLGATLRHRPVVPHGAIFELRLPVVVD